MIENFKIRYTQPTQLNDPFEAALLVNVAAAHQENKRIIESLSKEVVCETDEDRAELEAMKVELINEAKALASPHAIGRKLGDFISKAQGVLSLSRTNDSLLMWAHYGDSHRGYVLGLDESHPFFHRPDGMGKPTKPRNVVYTSKRIVVEAGSSDFYEQLLCVKSLEWAYEQEVRVFMRFGHGYRPEDFEKNSHDQIHLFLLPRECIKEVYIGANASPTTRAKILSTIDRRKLQVKLFEAYVAEDRYALKFREITQLHSYRLEEFFVRASSKTDGYTDVMFCHATLPTQYYVDYGPDIAFPSYMKYAVAHGR